MKTTGGKGPTDPYDPQPAGVAEFGDARRLVSVLPPTPPRGVGAVLSSRVSGLATRIVCGYPAERRANCRYRCEMSACNGQLAEILATLGGIGRCERIADARSLDRLHGALDAIEEPDAHNPTTHAVTDCDHRVLSKLLDRHLCHLAADELAAIAAATRTAADITSLGRHRRCVLSIIRERTESHLLGERRVDAALRRFLSETSARTAPDRAAAASAYQKLAHAPPEAGIAAARRTGLLSAGCSAGLAKEGMARMAADDDRSLQRLLARVPSIELCRLFATASPNGRDMVVVDAAVLETLQARFVWLTATLGSPLRCPGVTPAPAPADNPLADLRRQLGTLESLPVLAVVAFLESLPSDSLVELPDALDDLGLDAGTVVIVCRRLGLEFDRHLAGERIRRKILAAADSPSIPRVLAVAAETSSVLQALAKLGGIDPPALIASGRARIELAFRRVSPPRRKRLAEFLGCQRFRALLAAARSDTAEEAASRQADILAALDMLRAASGANLSLADGVTTKEVDLIALGRDLTLVDALAIHASLGLALGPLVSFSAQMDYARAIETLPSRPSGSDPTLDLAFEAGLATTTYAIASSAVAPASTKSALLELARDNRAQVLAVSRVANRRALRAIETWLVLAGKGIRLPDGRALRMSGVSEAAFNIRRTSNGEIVVFGTARHPRIAPPYAVGGRETTVLKPIDDAEAAPTWVAPGCEIRCSVEFAIDKNGEIRISRLPAVEIENLREVTPAAAAMLRNGLATAMGLNAALGEARMVEFRLFCARQDAADNLEFWEAVEFLAEHPCMAAAQALYSRYVSAGGESPISMPEHLRRRIDHAFAASMEKAASGGNPALLVAVFRPVQRVVAKALATNAWPRFQKQVAPPG